MFGRTLHTFTSRNVNPLMKGFDKTVVNNNNNSNISGNNFSATTLNVQTSTINSKSNTSSLSTYSTQTKKPAFTINEKRIEDVRVPHKPTSPHLTIYKFPLPAVMSIMHRATGICLAMGVAGVSGIALFAPHDPIFYIEALKTQYPMMIYPLKAGIALPLIYHSCTGIRHLIWDETLKGINVKSTEKTGMIILGITAAATAFFTFYSF